jgi:hypothetical protein
VAFAGRTPACCAGRRLCRTRLKCFCVLGFSATFFCFCDREYRLEETEAAKQVTDKQTVTNNTIALRCHPSFDIDDIEKTTPTTQSSSSH